MKFCTDWLVELCLRNDFVPESQLPWLRYCIEKRLSTAIGLFPFFVGAILLTNIESAVCFVGAFCVLRSRINGYHAKTLGGCLLVSLVTELIFLIGLYPVLTPLSAVLLTLICIVIMLLLAPFNDSKIHLSEDEVLALKVCVRKRSIILGVLVFASTMIQLTNITKGLATGTAMAAFMLCLAYMSKKGGSTNE